MDKKKEFLNLFPLEMRKYFQKIADSLLRIREIRFRADKPIIVWIRKEEYFLRQDGDVTKNESEGIYLKQQEIETFLSHVCKYSIYAYENELRQGYITVEGGHRIGVAGKIILEDRRIKNMKYISCVNIRIAHQIIGSADNVLLHLYETGRLFNTLIISPPGGGKTTLLRDIIRQVSNGNQYAEGMNVGVVDERSEIGGCFMGMAQNDIGIRTDILDACPKAEGMMMLIRSMAPQMLAIDELGGKEDIEALSQAIQCGCKIIATIHGYSVEDILKKPYINKLILDKIFQRYILMGNRDKAGNIQEIYDEELRPCLK